MSAAAPEIAVAAAIDPAPVAVSAAVLDGASTAGPYRTLRDVAAATAVLLAAIVLGSGGLQHLDPALGGYLGATIVAWIATVYRVSAFWRRPASVFYARAFLQALRDPRRLRRVVGAAGRDLAAQSFIRRRARGRWLAHLLLSFGTLASFAITLPLVFGWMHFVAEGGGHYRVILFTMPTARFAVDGAFAWLVFHGLSLAAIAVVLGVLYFLVNRVKRRGTVGATSGSAVAPLVLLLVVALSGLALPATRGHATLFPAAALLHEVAVVVLLVAMPFSKLGHVLIRPLQLGARVVRAEDQPRERCAECGGALAPTAQRRAVEALLAARGFHVSGHVRRCPSCRRREIATAQASLVDANFQPGLDAVRAEPGIKTKIGPREAA